MSPSPRQPSVGAGVAAGAAGALAGAFPYNTSGTTRTGQSSTQTGNASSNTSSQIQNFLNFINSLKSTQTGTSATTPTLSPEAQALMDQLSKQFGGLTAPSLTGYAANQTANINAASNAQSQAVNNIMAARGLSTSPVAGTAAAGIEQNRVNQITGMQQQLPLLQQQMNLADLAASSQFFQAMPRGQTTTTGQTTDTSQTGQTSQDQYSQNWSNFFNWLSNLSSGTSITNQSQGGGIGGALSSGISDALMAAMIFSDKRLKKDIKPVEKAIDKIKALKPVSWSWKDPEQGISTGFIAQDVEKVMPELVREEGKSGLGLKMINYAGVIPYLVDSIKELDKRLEVQGV